MHIAVIHASYKSLVFIMLGYILTLSTTQDVRDSSISGSSLLREYWLLILGFCLQMFGTSYASTKVGIKVLCSIGPELND